jgi:hypothetical protein
MILPTLSKTIPKYQDKKHTEALHQREAQQEKHSLSTSSPSK